MNISIVEIPKENLLFDVREDDKIMFEIFSDLNSCGWFILDSSLNGKDIYLEEIYIDEEYRGEGIGTKIMAQIKEILSKLGVKLIWLFVSFENDHAQHIYRKAGFEFCNYVSSFCYKMECKL